MGQQEVLTVHAFSVLSCEVLIIHIMRKTEFNDRFIIHFSHNSSETEAKRSAILFLMRTLKEA